MSYLNNTKTASRHFDRIVKNMKKTSLHVTDKNAIDVENFLFAYATRDTLTDLKFVRKMQQEIGIKNWFAFMVAKGWKATRKDPQFHVWVSVIRKTDEDKFTRQEAILVRKASKELVLYELNALHHALVDMMAKEIKKEIRIKSIISELTKGATPSVVVAYFKHNGWKWDELGFTYVSYKKTILGENFKVVIPKKFNDKVAMIGLYDTWKHAQIAESINRKLDYV